MESLRHLVLLIDLWLSKAILGQPDPFHPIGLPPSFMPPKLPGSSIDPEARPAFDEACQVLHGRIAGLRTYVDALTQRSSTVRSKRTPAASPGRSASSSAS